MDSAPVVIDVSKMTAEQIENLRVDKEKNLHELNIAYDEILRAKRQIERQEIDLSMKKKDLQIALDKARFSVRQCESEMRILAAEFWRKKR